MTEEELKKQLKIILTDNMQTYEDKVNEILGLFKQAGYVQLDPDQSLPENPYFNLADAVKGIASPSFTYAQRAREDMLKANFKKIKQPDKI